MRPFTSTISLDEARRQLSEHVRRVDRVERVPLADASGRVVAVDVTSPIDVPPFSRSAMDGYAVMAADTTTASLSSAARLRIIERIYTGQLPQHTVTAGTCAEIATGAPLPEGADAVVMVEDTRPAGEKDVDLLSPARTGQNIGRRGADISVGAPVVSAGEVLNPSRIGSLAAVGCADAEVYARPRVAILSTGNEVVEPGRSIAPGQIFDVNRYSLGAIVSSHGGQPVPQGSVPDTVDALIGALDSCADADLIVFSGGSSVGNRDLIVDVIAARGTMIFHGIAVKPGKPTAFALVRGVPFFGMPGNPTSCLSNAYVLLVPFLRTTARLPPYQPRVLRLPLGRRIVSPAGRHQFYTVRCTEGAAYPAFKGSGDITSLSQADGYIEIPADQSVIEEGTEVEVVLF
jgi:molybdopterin molybdotransferase